MIKKIKRTLLLILAVCILCLVFILCTQPGLKLAVFIAQQALGDQLKIEGSSGRLLGRMEFQNMVYQDQTTKYQIKSLTLDWQPIRLLSKQIQISKLDVDKVFITQFSQPSNKKSEEKNDFALPQLPRIKIRLNAKINAVQIKTPEARYKLSDIVFNGTYNTNKISIHSMSLSIKGYQLSTQGSLNLAQDNQLNLNFELLNPKKTLDIALNIKGSGGYYNLSGKRNNVPIKGRIHFAWGKPLIIKTDEPVSIGDNQIEATLNISSDLRISWSLVAPKLNQIIPSLEGAVQSQGAFYSSINGHIDTQFDFNANRLSWNNYQLNQFTINTKFSTTTRTKNHVHLQLKGLTIDSFEVSSFESNLNGALSSAQLDLKLSAIGTTLTSKAILNYSPQNIHLAMQSLNLSVNHQSQWHLSQRSLLTIASNNFTLTPLCLMQSKGSLCISGQYRDQKNWSLKLNSKEALANILSVFIPKMPYFNSQIDINLNVKNSIINGVAKLNLAPSVIKYEQLKIPFLGGNITAQFSNNNFQLSGTLKQTDKNYLSLTAYNPSSPNLASLNSNTLKAHVKLFFGDWLMINRLSNNQVKASGDLAGNFSLQGPLGAPKVDGNLVFKNAQIELPDLNLKLNHIKFDISAVNSLLTYQANVQSGPGYLRVKGTTQLVAPKFNTTLELSGKDFSIIDSPEYKIQIQPKLSLSNANGFWNLTGSIFIPRAKISPHNFSNTIELPSDVRFVGEKKQAPKVGLNSDVRIILGNEVLIDSLGLQGQLIGALDIQDKADGTTTASGQLKIVKGSFEAYGQKLTIDTGILSYAGGLIDNPSINLKASRTFEVNSQAQNNNIDMLPIHSNTLPSNFDFTDFNKVTVGVNATGSIHQPKIQLFSKPASMQQSDILSFLILGRPINQASKNDGELLIGALSKLNIGGSDSAQIMSQIQHNLGLDTLKIETRSLYDPEQDKVSDTTALVIGKALSPRLFINYSMGLLQDLSILTVTYKLNTNWTIRVESDGQANGFDVLYNFKRK